MLNSHMNEMNSKKWAVKNQRKNYEMLTGSSSNEKSALVVDMLYQENSEARQCPSAKKKEAQSKTFTIFFLRSTSLVSANPRLNVHQHSKSNQSIMAKGNRTAITGIITQKILSEPISGPTFQHQNHHFTKEPCYHCL